MEQKKFEVTDKLQKRDEDRLAEVQKRKKEKENASAENESSDFFLSNFNQFKRELESTLNTSDGVAKSGLPDYFDNMVLTLQKLQKFTTDTAAFLPSYEIQKAQESIAKLQRDIQERRDTLIPKKKFAFKSKKKVESLVDKPKVQVAKKEIKMQITDCNFSDVSSQTLVKTAEETNDKDVALARLTDCVVKLFGSPRAVHIDRLIGCTVLIGPISGSIIMDNCVNCTLVVACQQLRTHHTTKSLFYIHVTSKAIIEDCSELQFAPYNWEHDGLEESYKLSGLDRGMNNWDDVDDFNWLANDAHSPNWSILDESKRVKSWDI